MKAGSDSQKEERQGHKNRANSNSQQSVGEVSRSKIFHGTIIICVIVLQSISSYIISSCEGQDLPTHTQYLDIGEEDEGSKYLNERSADLPGVAMTMYTPLDRSPHPHH